MAHIERVKYVAKHTVVLLCDRGVRRAIDVVGHSFLVSRGYAECLAGWTRVTVCHLRGLDATPLAEDVRICRGRLLCQVVFDVGDA